MYILAFVLSFQVLAANHSQNVFEQSYPRDNTFCSFKGKKIEILIRGMNRLTEQNEVGFGEYLFYRYPDKSPVLMETNKYRTDSLKFFLGVSPLCSKSHGYKIDEKTFAVLFKKENRPFREKLVIQLFDGEKMLPLETIETDYLTDKAKKLDDGFAFSSASELFDPEIGKTSINGETYIFQEREFPVWVGYTSRGFELLPDLTYERSPWKKMFKDKNDFLTTAGWSEKEKKFTNPILYKATSHKLRQECLLLLKEKLDPKATSPWKCQAM